MAEVFEKTFERDTVLLIQAFFAQGLSGKNYLKIGEDNPHNPIMFHYFNGQNVEMWENVAGMQWFLEKLMQENEKGSSFLSSVVSDQRKLLQNIRPYWTKKSLTPSETEDYLSLTRRGVDNVIFYFFSGMNEQASDEVKNLSAEIRAEDDFMANSDECIRNLVVNKGYSDRIGNIVLPEELINLPPQEVLNHRAEHALLVGGQNLLAVSLESYSKEHPEFEFKSLGQEAKKAEQFSGQIAYKGRVTGVVRIVRNRTQMQEVKQGDILVSPMTTPDFLPAMQRAAAFVTDEGGIICHAAIVSREMKKPCIVGTKIATQILKDGDVVEVDAEKGVVRVLERAS